MDDLEEITPDDSIVPVYLDPKPLVPLDPVVIVDVSAARASGIAKLMKLGLSETEAMAIAGG